MLFLPDIGKLLLIFGGILILLGLFFIFNKEIFGLKKLPGDIIIHRDGFHFYFPLGACVFISVILTLIFWIIKILKK